jgi:hypothetical protein
VSTAWKENEEILDDLSDFLRHCVYDSERDLSIEAAQYAAERSLGAIVFLAICPNIPLIVPTLEARLLFTKPLQGLTRGIHAVFGRVIILGFFLLLISKFANLFDEVARMQVMWTQHFLMARWLVNDRKRLRLVRRYLNDAVNRVRRPRRDAIVRGLLSIVS